jgi:hypothetical protein
MTQMKYSFTAISRITLEHEEGWRTPILNKTDLILETSPNLDKKVYLDDHNLPIKEGVKPLTAALLHGLVANMHMAHEKGFWDSAEHLRFIIAELEKGFINPAKVSEGRF